MRKRYTVLGLSLVLALALAVPALGGPSNPIASISANVKKTANKALKRANQAKSQAKNAIGQANSAQSSANSAGEAAKKAQESADGAQNSANGAKATADAALAAAGAAEANANTRVKSSHQIAGTSTASNNTAAKTASASCPEAEPVLGGGFFVSGSETNKVTVNESDALFYGHGWFVAAEAITGQAPTWALTAVVMCGTK